MTDAEFVREGMVFTLHVRTNVYVSPGFIENAGKTKFGEFLYISGIDTVEPLSCVHSNSETKNPALHGEAEAQCHSFHSINLQHENVNAYFIHSIIRSLVHISISENKKS